MINLVPLDTADYPRWYEDEETTKWMIHGAKTHSSDYNATFYQHVKENPHQVRVFKIMYQDQHIGNTSLSKLDSGNNSAEFGIVIWNKDCRGKGIGTEATRLMCKFGFEVLALNRIYLGVLDSNVAGVMAYEKVGFATWGIARDEVLLRGHYEYVNHMDLHAHEWKRFNG